MSGKSVGLEWSLLSIVVDSGVDVLARRSFLDSSCCVGVSGGSSSKSRSCGGDGGGGGRIGVAGGGVEVVVTLLRVGM